MVVVFCFSTFAKDEEKQTHSKSFAGSNSIVLDAVSIIAYV